MSTSTRPLRARRIGPMTYAALALGVILALSVLLQILPADAARSTDALPPSSAAAGDFAAGELLPMFITAATLVIVLVASVLIGYARRRTDS